MRRCRTEEVAIGVTTGVTIWVGRRSGGMGRGEGTAETSSYRAEEPVAGVFG